MRRLSTTPFLFEKMDRKHIVYPSPRVSQLDAYILDGELFSLLKQQLADSFQLLSGKSWSYGQHPELWSLVLKLIIFRLTTYKSGSSYGLKLQNLKLSDSSTGKIIGHGTRLLILGTIFGDYLFKRLQSYLYSFEASSVRGGTSPLDRIKAVLVRNKETILKKIDDTIKILGLVNFVSFLVYGRYPTVLHRILGVSLTPVIADLLKFDGDKVNFEFQNRQLVWNVMTEFLVFILPLLQLRKLKRLVLQLLPIRTKDQFRTTSAVPVQTRFTNLPISQCAICIETIERRDIKAVSSHITSPFITNCGHIFCYVCLATRFNAIDNGNEDAEGCPRCRVKLTDFRAFGNEAGDVDEDAIMVEREEVDLSSDEEETEEKLAIVDADHSDDESVYDESDENREIGYFSEMEDLEEDDDDMDDDMDDDFEDDDAYYD